MGMPIRIDQFFRAQERSVLSWGGRALSPVAPIFAGALIGAGSALVAGQGFSYFALGIGAGVGTSFGWAIFRVIARPLNNHSFSDDDMAIEHLKDQLTVANKRISDLQDELVRNREEMERVVSDLEMNRSLIEDQASQSVELAEEMALQKMELEESKRRSDYVANHDLLTGLPNRRAFQEEMAARVEDAVRRNLSVGLLFIDLDKFKEVNDSLGHDAGDDLLRQVAEILTQALRGHDFVARLGGDEFAVLTEVSGRFTLNGAADLAERLRLQLQIPVATPKGTINVGATIGYALCPEHAGNAADLLHVADQVMYAGKRRGRNCVVAPSDLDDQSRPISQAV